MMNQKQKKQNVMFLWFFSALFTPALLFGKVASRLTPEKLASWWGTFSDEGDGGTHREGHKKENKINTHKCFNLFVCWISSEPFRLDLYLSPQSLLLLVGAYQVTLDLITDKEPARVRLWCIWILTPFQWLWPKAFHYHYRSWDLD